MECKKKENLHSCTCTWEGCDKKGLCCECLQFHWRKKELPACLFPRDVERTYDRSLKKFIEIYNK